MSRLVASFVLGALGFLGAACSAKDAAVAPTAVTLTFPSIEAAVASDTVQIQIFDENGADPSGACEDLVAEARSSQSLPTALIDVTTTACTLAAGGDPFTVGVGSRAFLVTASSSGTEILIGCTVESVEGGQLLVPVDLVPLSDSVIIAPTTCSALTDHCKGGC